MRLVILDFGTKEAIGFSTIANWARSKVILAPGQLDEFWRNAAQVLNEHVVKWKEIVRVSKQNLDNLIIHLKGAKAIRLLDEEQESALETVIKQKQHLDKLSAPNFEWEAFEKFADRQLLAIMNAMPENVYEEDAILKSAKSRVEAFNPPCRDKKVRPLGDCLIWEVVLHLLNRHQGLVWLATTDTDFSEPSDSHILNYFLQREVKSYRNRFEFFHENRSLGLMPGSQFKVLARLAETVPGHVTEHMQRTLEALSTISPIGSWMDFEDALSQLTYREREILKLRLGMPDGFQLTQTEAAHIFKISQPRVHQIERKALSRLQELLEEAQENLD